MNIVYNKQAHDSSERIATSWQWLHRYVVVHELYSVQTSHKLVSNNHVTKITHKYLITLQLQCFILSVANNYQLYTDAYT
jgi:hypothetical protein